MKLNKPIIEHILSSNRTKELEKNIRDLTESFNKSREFEIVSIYRMDLEKYLLRVLSISTTLHSVFSSSVILKVENGLFNNVEDILHDEYVTVTIYEVQDDYTLYKVEPVRHKQ